MPSFLLMLLALMLPPLPVAIKKGVSDELLVSVLLTFLGWLPGVVYAWWVVLKD